MIKHNIVTWSDIHVFPYFTLESRPSWSYDSWIYNYLCNQCLSLLTLWIRILLRRCVLDTTLILKFVSDLRLVCGFLRVLRFPPPIKLTATIKPEILLEVALSIINLNLNVHWKAMDLGIIAEMITNILSIVNYHPIICKRCPLWNVPMCFKCTVPSCFEHSFR